MASIVDVFICSMCKKFCHYWEAISFLDFNPLFAIHSKQYHIISFFRFLCTHCSLSYYVLFYGLLLLLYVGVI